jgi:hypothetical protein
LLATDQPALGLTCWGLCVALPTVVGIFFVRGKRILCTKIDKETITLKVPSASAAMAVSQHLHSGARVPAVKPAIAAG